MHEFKKHNKTMGVYWLKQYLKDTLICIKLKSREEIITLPNFEEYKDKSYEEHLHVLDKNKISEYTFKWQEKVFSSYELQKYSDAYNCSSETEIKYHDMIKDTNVKSNKVFTYIDEDYHLPLPIAEKGNYKPYGVLNLKNCFAKLHLGDMNDNVSHSMGHLFKSQDHISDNDQWMAMHIVLDNSEYNEESQILFKQEFNLLSLYHNVTHNYLMVSPDVNNLELKPYSVEDGDNILPMEYGVEINFEEKENGEDLKHLLNNLFKKWDKKQQQLLNFVMPRLGMKNVFVTFEIVSAFGFEMDNLYIDFQIKIPDDITVKGDLKGRTHVSKSSRREDKKFWGYGHVVELELEYATGMDLNPLKIILETISVDWWGRHRTEGYSCLTLSLEPGEHRHDLSCSRSEELDKVEAESRRFFVGGCHLIKDLDVLINPQLYEAKFRYVSTGSVAVRWRVVCQRRRAHADVHAHTQPHAHAQSLLAGAEAVLRHYKKAKATLAAATECLPTQLEQ
ncbi:tectonic-like complex member MKS1 isoform X1 [Vanessa tameamea]|uniref:Tectonic-like complex member MKS1 isoform X1 n=1 Tax=Vanessa tameamea TaxID=334116 RepID=A0A8B8HR71_VANTA